MRRRLLRAVFIERLVIFFVSTSVFQVSRAAALRGCGYGRASCDMRLTMRPIVPCVKCAHSNDVRCTGQKWRSLCDMPDAIKCATTTNCVLLTWIMDGKDDCGDGSDEEPCRLLSCSPSGDPPSTTTVLTTVKATTTTTEQPSTTTVSMTTNTPLILTQPITFPTQCEAGEFRCLSGECIDGRLVLDGKQDCYDNTDEEYCLRHAMACSTESPCSYHPDIAAFGCGCPTDEEPNPKGICEPTHA